MPTPSKKKTALMESEEHNGISQWPERDWHLLTNASTIFHNNKSMAVMVTIHGCHGNAIQAL
jgi:hypothetical protein